MKKRSCKITFVLQEGHKTDAKQHTLNFAGKVFEQLMAQRLAAGLPVVTGLLQGGTLFFRAVSTADKHKVTISPQGIYSGEPSSPADMKKNKEVKAGLTSLACS